MFGYGKKKQDNKAVNRRRAGNRLFLARNRDAGRSKNDEQTEQIFHRKDLRQMRRKQGMWLTTAPPTPRLYAGFMTPCAYRSNKCKNAYLS
ncbi:MAG TPA: hypothetical protein VL625_02435 [Patescibacteria group bacterium]|nr:hypothetical protein [Patescibacteria group bacterium]